MDSPGSPSSSSGEAAKPKAKKPPHYSAVTPMGFANGKYTMIARMGRGTMADVLLALAKTEDGSHKPVVLKRIHAHLQKDAAFVQLLLEQARLAAGLDHPAVVDTLEVGTHNGLPFIVTELLDGTTLDRTMQRLAKLRKTLDVALAVRIAIDILDALEHAHEQGVLHRDLAPSNVFLTYDGGVKLVDFALAKARVHLSETAPGVVKGKFAYVSPEQARGDALDLRMDLFGLGAVMWEMIAGKRLFQGLDNLASLKSNLERPVPRLTALRPGLPAELDSIVQKALAREPDARWSDAEEMKDELERVAKEHDLEGARGDLAKLLQELFAEDRAEEDRELSNCIEAGLAKVAVQTDTSPFGRADAADVDEEAKTAATRVPFGATIGMAAKETKPMAPATTTKAKASVPGSVPAPNAGKPRSAPPPTPPKRAGAPSAKPPSAPPATARRSSAESVEMELDPDTDMAEELDPTTTTPPWRVTAGRALAVAQSRGAALARWIAKRSHEARADLATRDPISTAAVVIAGVLAGLFVVLAIPSGDAPPHASSAPDTEATEHAGAGDEAPAPAPTPTRAQTQTPTPTPTLTPTPPPAPDAAAYERHRTAALAHYHARHYHSAAVEYELATRADPTRAGAYAGLGASVLAGHRSAQSARRAVEAYQRAVELEPRSSGYYAALGRALLKARQRAEAIAAYERAVQLDGSNAAAARALAQLRR